MNIKKIKLWTIADTHFGHDNIIRHCNRPFANIKEHDETMIENWNSVVATNDIVRHLGDFAYTCTREYAQSIFDRLKGQKHLTTGNHDKIGRNLRGWKSIDNYSEIEREEQKIILSHYPMLSWNKSYRGSWMLFGHVHGNVKNHGRSLDVGVDCWNYFPVDFETLKTHPAMNNQEKIL